MSQLVPLHQVKVIHTICKTLWSSLCKLDCIKEPSLQCLCLTWSRMTSRSLSPWPTWPYRYGVVLVDVEEYTGSLNESLLILCSSLTKSNQGWRSVTSQVRIVHVNIVNQVCILFMSDQRLGGALWIVGAGLPSSCWEPCGWSSHACQGSEYQKAKNIFKNIH